MNISVCIITKNEQHYLKNCLQRLSNLPVEIVVVDTGSTDESVAIAKKYTESVYNFEWCDDFSAARNYAASMAKHDLIIAVDSDEYLSFWQEDFFAKLVASANLKIGKLHQKNHYISNGVTMSSCDYVNRIYDRRIYTFAGKVHEQLVSKEGVEVSTYIAPFIVEHQGYLGDKERREEKANRNIALLKKELEDNPTDTYLLYQIGKSFYFKGEYLTAIEYFYQCFDYQMDSRLEYVVDLIVTLGYALLNTDKIAEALVLENVYDDFCKNANYLFVLGLIYMQNGRFEDAICQLTKATDIPITNIEGANSYLAYYNIGVIYECLGQNEKALSYYYKAGEYTPAKDGILRIAKDRGLTE